MAAVCLLLVCGCASQQDVMSLNRRIGNIERRYADIERGKTQLKAEIDSYTQSLQEKELALRTQAAELRAKINDLKAQIQGLNGKIEEAEFQLRERLLALAENEEKLNRIAETTGRNTTRIAHIEAYLNLEKSTAKPPKPHGGVKPEDRKAGADERYAAAKRKFDQGDYAAARQAFEKFMEAFPKSPQADNAQFWIGETYYREKWYEKAILEYQTVIENYPKGNKIPAALLKQGLAFQELGDAANARLILKKLIEKYPETSEARVAQKELAGLK